MNLELESEDDVTFIKSALEAIAQADSPGRAVYPDDESRERARRISEKL